MHRYQSKTKFNGRKILSALFALAFAPMVIAPDQARAEPTVTAQNMAAYQAADENHRIRILIKLVEAGYVNAADQMLVTFPLQGPLAANRSLYVQGLIAHKRGHLTEAVSKFRAALASDPHLTLVRVELAKTLAELDENDSAKHHLKLLESETQDPQQLASIRSFVESLDAKHPLTFSGFVSIAPSSNINQGSSHATVVSPGLAGINGLNPVGTIAPGSQATSGIGIMGGVNVGFTHRLDDNLQAVLAASLSSTFYPSSNIITVNASQSAEIRYLIQDGYVGLGGIASQSADPVNLALGYTSYGPRVSLSKLVTPRDQITASAAYEWRNYVNSPVSNGNAVTVNGVFTHALDSTANIAVLGGYDNVTQQLAYNSYQDVSFGLGFYKELPRGITLQGQGTARFAGFNDVNPLQAITRQDQQLTGSLTVTKRDWNVLGFAPSLNYTYTRNNSNITLFDFDSHNVDFRLTKNF